MQPLVAAAELADIVGLGVEAAVAVVDVETVVEIAAAIVAVTKEAAASSTVRGGATVGAELRITGAEVD